ncbi:MAG: M20 family metallopeptidase [Candidatus Omnitrophica bacterium]|nr:M20 family metallopeptidase [Candidatus Omnitrophota bacterium]
MINKHRLIKLTQKLISVNSENPPGRELALAKFIERDMRSLGLAVRTYTYAKGRPNVVATLKGVWPRPKAAKEAILLTPHVDTVPIGKGWKHKPLGGEIRNGKLYGRGATDDKGNLASCMELMRSLVEDGVKLDKDVIMAATVDEETGSRYGIIPLLEHGILRPRLALVMDSDEFNAIIAQKGLIHMRIQILGKKAHGAYVWQGVNAIEIAARVINKLKTNNWRFARHPLLRPPTMNVGVIHGGEKVNVVSDFCEFALDARFVPGMDPKKILNKIRAVIKSETGRFRVEVDDVQMPYEINRRHVFVRTYLKTANGCGCQARPRGSEGATVMTFFRKYGIAAFATGFGAPGTAHTNDEYIHIRTLFRGTQMLEQFIKEYDRL